MGLGDYLKPLVSIGAAALGWEIGGPIGGAIGWSLGMGIGGSLFPPEAEKTAAMSLGPAQLFKASADYGGVVPVLRGCRRTGGNLIWTNDPVLVTSAAQVFDYISFIAAIMIVADSDTTPDEMYAATFAYGVCHGIAHTLKVYEGKKEYLIIGNHGYLLNEGENIPPEYREATYDEQVALVVAKGIQPSFRVTQYAGDQVIADPEIIKAKGIGVVPPYTNLHYIVFMDFPMLTNDIPKLSFETTRMECADYPAVVNSYGDALPGPNVSDHYRFRELGQIAFEGGGSGGIFPAIYMFDSGDGESSYSAINFTTTIPGLSSKKIGLVDGLLTQVIGSVILTEMYADKNNVVNFPSGEYDVTVYGNGLADVAYPDWWTCAYCGGGSEWGCTSGIRGGYAAPTQPNYGGSGYPVSVSLYNSDSEWENWAFFNHYARCVEDDALPYPDCVCDTWIGNSNENTDDAVATTTRDETQSNVMYYYDEEYNEYNIRPFGDNTFSLHTDATDTMQAIYTPITYSSEKTTTVSGTYKWVDRSDYWYETDHYIVVVEENDYSGEYEESSSSDSTFKRAVEIPAYGGRVGAAYNADITEPYPVSLSVATDVGDFIDIIVTDSDDPNYYGNDAAVFRIDASLGCYMYSAYSETNGVMIYGWITSAGQHHRLVFDDFDFDTWQHPFVSATYIDPTGTESTITFGSEFSGWYGDGTFMAGIYS